MVVNKEEFDLTSVYQNICPTALHLDSDLYIGEGGCVSCYCLRHRRFMWRTEVFRSALVHGIVAGRGRGTLIVFGKNALSILTVRHCHAGHCATSQSANASGHSGRCCCCCHCHHPDGHCCCCCHCHHPDGHCCCIGQNIVACAEPATVAGWIVAAASLSSTDSAAPDCHLILDSTGTVYCVTKFHTEDGVQLLHVQPRTCYPDKCILYSGCVVGGATWQCSILIGGTVFSQVLVWRAGDAQLLHRLCGHSGAIFSVVWHARSGRLVTTSDDRTVRVWHVTSPADAAQRTATVPLCDRGDESAAMGAGEGMTDSLCCHDNGHCGFARAVCVCFWWRLATVRSPVTLYGHRARVWRCIVLEAEPVVTKEELVEQWAEPIDQWAEPVEERAELASVGEDSTVCLWTGCGRLLRTWLAHGGASVRAVAHCSRRHLLATAGGDCGIVLWPLLELCTARVNCIRTPLSLNSTRSAVKRVCGSSSSGGTVSADVGGDDREDTLAADIDGGGGDFIRCVFALSSERCLAVSDRGVVIDASIGDASGALRLVAIGPAEPGAAAAAAPLAGYCVGSVTPDSRHVVLANGRGQLVLLKHTDAEIVWLCTQSVVSGKIFLAHWLDGCSVLVSYESGGVSLLRLADECGGVCFRRLCEWRLPCRKSLQWLNCASLVSLSSHASITMVACGDRDGFLHLLVEGQMCVSHSVRAHGRHGVSGVTAPTSGCHVISCGRDGWLRYWRVAIVAKSAQLSPDVTATAAAAAAAAGGGGGGFSFKDVGGEKLPWDWVCSVREVPSSPSTTAAAAAAPAATGVGGTVLLAMGFHASEFVVRCLTMAVDVWRVRCGGGHRSWSLATPTNQLNHASGRLGHASSEKSHVSNDTTTFFWLSSRQLLSSSVRLCHIMPHHVRPGGVCGTILSALILPHYCASNSTGAAVTTHVSADHFSAGVCCSNGRSSSSRQVTVVMAGEDTSVRVLSVSRVGGALCVTPARQASGGGGCGSDGGHIGSVRHLCVLANGRYLVSGGGRGQLVLWQQLQLLCSTHNSCVSSCPQLAAVDSCRLEQLQDVRYMQLAALDRGETECEGEAGSVVAAAASDGSVRVFGVLRGRLVWLCQLVSSGCGLFSRHCVLQLHWLNISGATYLAVLDTTGRLCLLRVTLPPLHHRHRKQLKQYTVRSDNCDAVVAIVPDLATVLHQGGVNAFCLLPPTPIAPTVTSTTPTVTSTTPTVTSTTSTVTSSAAATGSDVTSANHVTPTGDAAAGHTHCDAVQTTGASFVTGGDDGAICHYQLTSGATPAAGAPAATAAAGTAAGATGGAAAAGDGGSLVSCRPDTVGLQLCRLGYRSTAHASQVTGVCCLSEHHVATVSVDQRVCVWQLSHGFAPLVSRYTHVADVKGMVLFDLTPVNRHRYLLVFGEGSEIFQLTTPQTDAVPFQR